MSSSSPVSFDEDSNAENDNENKATLEAGV
jgi:hypothetical protein